MKHFLNLSLVALLALVAGCATSSTDTAQGSGPTDICHVCKYNYDLACVCVKVKDTTPKTEYQGVTYYFCSEDCRAAFARNAAKYLPKSGQKP